MKHITSIKCEECGNDVWYPRPWAHNAICTNCHFERPFHSRKRGSGISPSQQDAINKIHAWFLEYGRVEKLHSFGISNPDGIVWVSVETKASPYTNHGAHIMIGRRGGIQIADIYDLTEDKKRTARFYAKMLKGQLLSWCWGG